MRVGDNRNGFVTFPVKTEVCVNALLLELLTIIENKKTDLASYRNRETTISRCGTDFVGLRRGLVTKFPTVIVPPLVPETKIGLNDCLVL